LEGFESAFLANLESTYLFEKHQHLLENHVRFIGTYYDDEIIVFRGQCSDEWLHNWLWIFQSEVDRLLGTVNIQFTMEIWRPGEQSTVLGDSEVSIPGIGTFHCISVNGKTSFPYLDIQLLWNETGRLNFSVYWKPGELVKYLNTTSHHHKNHKAAVLLGVKLHLALLTTAIADNECLSM
jgi:hypothetical protein